MEKMLNLVELSYFPIGESCKSTGTELGWVLLILLCEVREGVSETLNKESILTINIWKKCRTI
jgi:hypothetical protein